MSAFRYHHRLQVRFRDCDPMGHANNAAYFTYMEQARWSYWLQLTGNSHPTLPGVILARAECDFLRPARPGEWLDVWLGATRLGRSSFTIECEILGEDKAPVARGLTVQVMFDYAEGKSVVLPDWFRARIEEYEGRT